MRILFLILLYISVTENNLIVKDAGISLISKGDIAMVFYIIVQNVGNTSYNVTVKMEKCCELFSETEMDCQMMQLIGGNMSGIKRKQIKHLSLIYPNMYLHNRNGQCFIIIKYEIYKQIRVKIEFNTTISKRTVNPILKGYYSRKKLMYCSTIDLDPLESCMPVNCEMKYLGSRNFFNHYWNRCQKVPICIADFHKDLPDVAYVPICNQCKDLENAFTPKDAEYLQSGKIEDYWESQVSPMLSVNIRCHHGTLNNETGFCICSDGWMTAPIDNDEYEPGLSVYHMCNTKIYSLKNSRNSKLKEVFIMIGIVGAVISVILLCTSFLCHLIYHAMFYPPPSVSSLSSCRFLDNTITLDDLHCAKEMDVTSAESYYNVNYCLLNPSAQKTSYTITEPNEEIPDTYYEYNYCEQMYCVGSSDESLYTDSD